MLKWGLELLLQQLIDETPNIIHDYGKITEIERDCKSSFGYNGDWRKQMFPYCYTVTLLLGYEDSAWWAHEPDTISERLTFFAASSKITGSDNGCGFLVTAPGLLLFHLCPPEPAVTQYKHTRAYTVISVLSPHHVLRWWIFDLVFGLALRCMITVVSSNFWERYAISAVWPIWWNLYLVWLERNINTNE